MTKTQAVDAIKGMGLAARLRDGEIRVNLAGGVEDTAYYTTDAEDAVESAKLMAAEVKLVRVDESITRQLNGAALRRDTKGGVIFVRLPRELWRSCDGGPCSCQYCKGEEGFWDTLAVPVKPSTNDTCYTVHMPELSR